MYKKLLLLPLVVTLLFLFVGSSSFAGQTDGLLKAMEAIGFAPVPKTGQTESYPPGDDGDLQMGITWPDPRFIDNEDGTVTDNLTGLIWLKNADCFNVRTWNEALSDSNSLADEQCGLTDGSSEGDWRLANARELSSLIDFGQFDIALPAGHPFINVQPESYWSSTTVTDIIQQAWRMCIHCGHLSLDNKTDHHYVWPVRSGN